MDWPCLDFNIHVTSAYISYAYKKPSCGVNEKSEQHRFSFTGQGSKFRPFGISSDPLGPILVSNIPQFGALVANSSKMVHLLEQDSQFLSLLLIKQHLLSLLSVCWRWDNLHLGQCFTNTVYKYLQWLLLLFWFCTSVLVCFKYKY